jgi:positive regulator of sigma E activity
MKDSGLVITTTKDIAEVQIQCFDGCQNCTASSLCIGNKKNLGRLSARNPLHALPGDEVKIHVPEAHYSKALILLFGGLLLAALVGMGAGYMLALFFPLPSSFASLFGLVAGLVIGGGILAKIFRRKNKEQLYPVIIDIIQKGDCYGSA